MSASVTNALSRSERTSRIRDKEIQELQNEIADLRRKESEAHQALTQSNQTIKTSTELGAVERAWGTANAAVATRNNIATRIAGIEKKIGDLRNDQEAFSARARGGAGTDRGKEGRTPAPSTAQKRGARCAGSAAA